MSKKKLIPSKDCVKYKQIDLTYYFKVSNKLNMKPSNKENTVDSIKLHNIANDGIAVPKPKVLLELPFAFPQYQDSTIDSEEIMIESASKVNNSDSAFESIASNPRVERNCEPNSIDSFIETTMFCSKIRKNFKKCPTKSTTRARTAPGGVVFVDSTVIILSSDDEDFVPTQKKGKQYKKLFNKTVNATSQVDKEQHIKANPRAKVKRKLYQTYSVSENEKQNTVEESQIPSKIYIRKDLYLPESRQAPKNKSPQKSQVSIGVHHPSSTQTLIQKPLPKILEKKRSGANLNLRNKTLTQTIEPIAGCSGSTNNVLSKKPSIATRENINVPCKDVTIYSSKKPTFLQNCSISPIRASSTPVESPISSPVNMNVSNRLSSNSENLLSKLENVSSKQNTEKTPVKSPISQSYSSMKTPNGNLPKTPLKNASPTRLKNWSPRRKGINSPKKTSGRLSTKTDKGDGKESDWNPLALQLIRKIMQYVMSHDHFRTMLTSDDVQLLNRFLKMPREEYIFCCIKLYTRMQKWNNIFKFCTSIKLTLSDHDVRDMYNFLNKEGFIETDYSSESCNCLLNHLLQKDIKDICEKFRLKLTTKKKPDMIQKLLDNCDRQSTLTCCKSTEEILKERIKDKMGQCIKLSSSFYNLLKKIHVLYSFTTSDFQNTSDLYLFLIRIETMDIIMPQIRIDTNFQIFSSIAEFSSFAEAYECKKALQEAIDKKETSHVYEFCTLAYSELKTILQSPPEPRPIYLMRFTAGSKYTKVLSLGAKHLTKHYPNEVEEWLIFLLNQDQYCQEMQGLWYDLLIMVQNFYLKQHYDATETLINGLSNKDLTEVALYDLTYRAEAMKRRKTNKITTLQYDNLCFVQPAALEEFPAIEINARAVHDNTSGKKRQYIEKTDTGRNVFNVEQVALNYYLQNGFTEGIHCEGSLLSTILFVLFWDIIYDSNIPGVFISELQYYPLDLWSEEFYLKRQQAIDLRLEEIKIKWPHDKLEYFVNDIWENHAYEKSLVSQSLVEDSAQLFTIILCIGRVKLARILERIIKKFKMYHSGLPDLFLWNVEKKKCKFVEVKGEKDKLSTKQKLWLNFLRSIGADIEVCHVHTIGSNVRKGKRKL